MDATIPDKPYFRIGEVSKILGIETYVVRYWESEFKNIKPIRTGADQRRYRKKDVEELLLIKKLLYEEGFTIAGAKKRLQDLKREAKEGTETCSLELQQLIEIKRGLQELKSLIG